MNIEFDTGVTQQGSLNGWFSGFCPSNGIADKNNKKVKTVLAEKAEWDKKYTSLENGQQASEWGDLKNEVARTQQLIDEEKRNLQQEKSIADALGLGAFCNGAVSKRKKSEKALSDAEKSLGEIKGAFEVLERQQKEGISRASEVIETNNATLQALKSEVSAVKGKITAYKAQRDAEKIAKEQQALADAKDPKKISQAGFLSKENAPLVIGGLLLAGTVIYFTNKKKEAKKRKIKKVTA